MYIILLNLSIYNQLTLFSRNNIGPDRIGLEISLVLNKMMYLSYKQYQIMFRKLFL